MAHWLCVLARHKGGSVSSKIFGRSLKQAQASTNEESGCTEAGWVNEWGSVTNDWMNETGWGTQELSELRQKSLQRAWQTAEGNGAPFRAFRGAFLPLKHKRQRKVSLKGLACYLCLLAEVSPMNLLNRIGGAELFPTDDKSRYWSLECLRVKMNGRTLLYTFTPTVQDMQIKHAY